MPTSPRSATLLALAWILNACGGEKAGGPAPAALALAIAAGDAQSGTAGVTLATRPSVRLTRGGAAVAGRTITFAVASGGGSVLNAQQVTDANGVATVGAWTLGPTAGTNTLTASAAEVSPVTFTATGTAGPAANLVRGTGNAQNATVGQAVATRPSVRVTDANDNGVAGVTVTFAVAAGGGAVTGATGATDAAGTATVGGWTLGPLVGENRLTATVAGTGITGNPVTFTATGTAGPAAKLQKTAGDGQQARYGTAVATRPAVRVTDASDNPVAGVAVTFAVASGGGTITGATATTDATGLATVGTWTLGSTLGANTVTATIAGAGVTGNPATFTATAIAGPPALAAKQGGDAQTAVAGSPVATRPAVRVTDAAGNPAEGVAVTFAVASGGGTVTGASATTDASGVATVGSWTLGSTAGPNTLTATVAGNGITGNPLTFTATGTAGPAAAVAKVAGDAQSAIAGSAVATAPSVQVTDANGNAVAGVAVTFSVATGGGAVTGAAQVTDAAGVATVGSWTLGAAPGANTLTATAAGSGLTGNPATFTATGAIDPTSYAGNWTGSWRNNTFGSTGSATMTVTVNTTTRAIALNLDLNGNVFGGGDPPAETFNGTYGTGGGFTVSGPSALFGAFTLTVTPSGAVTATGLNPRAGISRVDFTGTATGTAIAINYTITFTGGGTAQGTLNLAKP